MLYRVDKWDLGLVGLKQVRHTKLLLLLLLLMDTQQQVKVLAIQQVLNLSQSSYRLSLQAELLSREIFHLQTQINLKFQQHIQLMRDLSSEAVAFPFFTE